MSRVLVVWCPDWPVTAVGIDAAMPGAVVDGDRVAACTAAARAGGVRRGQRVRDAQRRCPEMVVRDRDLDAEGRLFEVVVAAVSSSTPRVEVVRPGVCAFPAAGAARFHGGEEPLRTLVQDSVVEAGHDCGVGIADGLFAAELAARADDGGVIVPPGGDGEFLAPYPLDVLDLPELADLLRRLGIWTLGRFAALPAGDVAGRFGAAGARAHLLASGAPTPCTTGCARRGSPACGWPSMWASTTAACTNGCGGTRGRCPRSRWPSGCAGSFRPSISPGRPTPAGAGSRSYGWRRISRSPTRAASRGCGGRGR